MSLARTPSQIGAALQRRRRSLGLTQAQLAERVRARQGTVSRLEAGRGDAKLSTLLDMLAALDLELVIQPRQVSEPANIAKLF